MTVTGITIMLYRFRQNRPKLHSDSLATWFQISLKTKTSTSPRLPGCFYIPTFLSTSQAIGPLAADWSDSRQQHPTETITLPNPQTCFATRVDIPTDHRARRQDAHCKETAVNSMPSWPSLARRRGISLSGPASHLCLLAVRAPDTRSVPVSPAWLPPIDFTG
jgi:hypothetical protein